MLFHVYSVNLCRYFLEKLFISNLDIVVKMKMQYHCQQVTVPMWIMAERAIFGSHFLCGWDFSLADLDQVSARVSGGEARSFLTSLCLDDTLFQRFSSVKRVESAIYNLFYRCSRRRHFDDCIISDLSIHMYIKYGNND